MQIRLIRTSIRRPIVLLILLVVAHLAAGCTVSSSRKDGTAGSSGSQPQSHSARVIRYGRYTFVELVPATPQQDLMQQVIDLTVPAGPDATVGVALRFVLLHSGYTLCEDREETRELEAFPLPAAHVRLGPLLLRDVLELLVGHAWQLEVDEANRKVCFARRQNAPADASSKSPRSRAPKPSRGVSQ